MVSPESPYIKNYAEQLDTSETLVRKQIVEAFCVLTQLRDGLQENKKDKFKILAHEKFITTSFWAADYEDENSVMQMEHKPYGYNRYYTYGFQVRRNRSNKEFFDTLIGSSMNIIKTAREVRTIELLEGDNSQVIVNYLN